MACEAFPIENRSARRGGSDALDFARRATIFEVIEIEGIEGDETVTKKHRSMNVPPPGAGIARIDALWPDLADGTHRCDDGAVVNDADVPFVPDGRDGGWCGLCGQSLPLPGTAGGPAAR